MTGIETERPPVSDGGPDGTVPNEPLVELHTMLARCVAHPDDATAEAIRSGELVERIRDRAAAVGLDLDRPSLPNRPREAYLRTFEGFDGDDYAPPAESVYEPWWDGTERGLLSGPPAHDMRRRYDAVGIDTPDAYPADHLALELEYAGLLLENGDPAEYRAFLEVHFGWLPALRDRVERTSEVAFHRWAVDAIVRLVDRVTAEAEAEATTTDIAIESEGGDHDE